MSLSVALGKIAAQQSKYGAAVWTVGDHLSDILRSEPHLAELVAQDLDVKEMSLAECEKKIKAYADAHKNKAENFSHVPFKEAERIIREFYGLPLREEAAEPAGDNLIRLEDFF